MTPINRAFNFKFIIRPHRKPILVVQRIPNLLYKASVCSVNSSILIRCIITKDVTTKNTFFGLSSVLQSLKAIRLMCSKPGFGLHFRSRHRSSKAESSVSSFGKVTLYPNASCIKIPLLLLIF